MLKNYVKKIAFCYNGLIDEDDAFQECILKALEVSDRDYIRSPRNYFIGVFDNTIKMMGKKEYAEQTARQKILERVLPKSTKIIQDIDLVIKRHEELTQKIWFGLKEFKGNIRKIMGLYTWHTYRIDKKHNDISHLEI